MTRRFPGLLGLLAVLSSCFPPGEAGKPVPPGPVFEESISFEVGLFYPGDSREDPRTALDALLARDFAGFTRIDEVEEKEVGDRRIVSTDWVTDGSYVAPDPEGLSHFGRGLDRAQIAALQGTENALRLIFRHQRKHAWTALRDSQRLTSALARRTGGLIWDQETREMFTPDFWDEHRVAGWTAAGPPPDIREHFTIHSYRTENGYRRAISLGLRKLGLPDLVMEDLAASSTRMSTVTINLLAQAMTEGAEVGRNGEFDLDLHRLGPSPARDVQLENLAENAKGRARLRLVEGVWEEGDPENRLYEIVFDRYSGPDVQARQMAMQIDFFGTEEDPAHDVEHGEEVLAASRKARERLLGLKPGFQAGLPLGEVLFVKAPFRTTDGGQEWMWVEVVEWKGTRITGSLLNQPVKIPSLKEGQEVEVSEEEVFDYIHQRADGSTEGNETARLLHLEG